MLTIKNDQSAQEPATTRREFLGGLLGFGALALKDLSAPNAASAKNNEGSPDAQRSPQVIVPGDQPQVIRTKVGRLLSRRWGFEVDIAQLAKSAALIGGGVSTTTIDVRMGDGEWKRLVDFDNPRQRRGRYEFAKPHLASRYSDQDVLVTNGAHQGVFISRPWIPTDRDGVPSSTRIIGLLPLEATDQNSGPLEFRMKVTPRGGFGGQSAESHFKVDLSRTRTYSLGANSNLTVEPGVQTDVEPLRQYALGFRSMFDPAKAINPDISVVYTEQRAFYTATREELTAEPLGRHGRMPPIANTTEQLLPERSVVETSPYQLDPARGQTEFRRNLLRVSMNKIGLHSELGEAVERWTRADKILNIHSEKEKRELWVMFQLLGGGGWEELGSIFKDERKAIRSGENDNINRTFMFTFDWVFLTALNNDRSAEIFLNTYNALSTDQHRRLVAEPIIKAYEEFQRQIGENDPTAYYPEFANGKAARFIDQLKAGF